MNNENKICPTSTCYQKGNSYIKCGKCYKAEVKLCITCGKEIEKGSGKYKYCGQACYPKDSKTSEQVAPVRKIEPLPWHTGKADIQNYTILWNKVNEIIKHINNA